MYSDTENLIEFNENQDNKNHNNINTDSIDNNIEKLELLYNNVYENLTSQISQLRELKTTIRKMKKLNKKINHKIKKTSIKKKEHSKGFHKKEPVPNKLIKLLNLDENICLKRTEVVKKIHVLLNERNLKYEKDKRVFRADKQIMKIFKLNKNVNEAVDPRDKKSFSQYNLQTYLANIYKDK